MTQHSEEYWAIRGWFLGEEVLYPDMGARSSAPLLFRERSDIIAYQKKRGIKGTVVRVRVEECEREL